MQVCNRVWCANSESYGSGTNVCFVVCQRSGIEANIVQLWMHNVGHTVNQALKYAYGKTAVWQVDTSETPFCLQRYCAFHATFVLFELCLWKQGLPWSRTAPVVPLHVQTCYMFFSSTMEAGVCDVIGGAGGDQERQGIISISQGDCETESRYENACGAEGASRRPCHPLWT